MCLRVCITLIIISIFEINSSGELSNVFKPFSNGDTCYDESIVLSNSDQSYSLFHSTKRCSNLLNKYKKSSDESSYCRPGLVDLEITPVFRAAQNQVYPYATININLKIHEAIEAAFVRLECLNTQSGEDIYCSNDSSLYHDDIRLLPCRGIQFDSSNVVFPAQFNYKCFRLYPHSTTAINVSIFPQDCIASSIITAPHLEEMFPNDWINRHQNGLSEITKWSPMIMVDLSESDGVWLKIPKPEGMRCKRIEMNIFEDIKGKAFYMKSLTLNCTDEKLMGIKWFDVKKGRYYITAFIPSGDCSQRCEGNSTNCKICPHTEIEFTIYDNHISIIWKIGMKISEIPIIWLLIMFIVLLIVLSIIAALIFIPRRKIENGPPDVIPLIEMKKLLLIYAEDTPAHKQTIETFRDCLQQNAHTNATINEDMLLENNCQPSKWINHVYSIMPKHLIVLSPLATKVIEVSGSEDEGKYEIEQTQPYPDMFKTGFDKVLRECALCSRNARSMIGLVTLPYSGPIPRKLIILGLPTFSLPDDFTKLTAFIHQVDIRNRNVANNLTTEMKFVLERRIETTKRDMESRPKWVETRWIEVEKPIDISSKVPMAAPPVLYETHQERVEASERLNLLPPDSSDEEDHEEVQQFQLYPPDEDDDIIIEEDEEAEEAEENEKGQAETGV